MNYIERINRLPANTFQQLNEVVAENLEKEVFPSVSLTVGYQGEWLFEAGWGWIDPDTKQYPVTPGTLFDLASVTKPFTVSAFHTLLSEGKVRLEDRLVEVIPEFGELSPRSMDGGQDPHTKQQLEIPDNVKGKTVDPAQVTFRHLLTHTSGLPPWRDVYNAAGTAPPPPDEPDPISQDERWQQALKALCTYPFVGQPGETVRYSDVGLMLLGEAVSRLHGTPGELDKAVRDRILAPLDLQSMIYNPVRNGIDRTQIAKTEYDDTWRGRRCWGEVHDENACGVGGAVGHAGLFGAVGDLARFGQAWCTFDARLGIDPEIMQMATQFQAEGNFRFGLGWMLKALEGSSAGDVMSDKTYGHTGFTGPTLWIDPEHQLVVACLNNRVYAGREKEGVHPFRRTVHNILGKGLIKA